MDRGISQVVVLFIFFAVCSPSVSKEQASKRYCWYYSVVDRDAQVGGFTTLRYDQKGLPNIAYTKLGEIRFRALKFARFDGQGWQIMVVDPKGNGRAKMVLDSNDHPHVIYHDNVSSKVMYAYYNGEKWNRREIDSSLLSGNAGYDASLAVDSYGGLHICYAIDYIVNGKDEKAMSYAFLDATNFFVRHRIDSVGVNGKWCSMVLDQLERPATAYYNVVRDQVMFALLDNGEWKIETIDEETAQGRYAFIARAPGNDFYVSFYSRALSRIRLAHGRFGSWVIEDVTEVSGATTFTTPNPLALDAQGNPYIAFHEIDGGDLKLAYKVNNEWQIETVDTVGIVGEHASIAINPDGMPAISYYDATNGFLRLAVASLTPPVDSDGDEIPDYLEVAEGTNPWDVDSDDDGLADGEEDLNHNGLVESYETDPRNPDTDGDGIQDGTEAGRTTGVSAPQGIGGTDMATFVPDKDPITTTNMLLFDTDGDGLGDGREDKNNDGLEDFDETDPNNPDTDGDGFLDGIEAQLGLSPLDLDSDDDGIADSEEDKNLDGILQSDETDPVNADTDKDGLPDGLELGVKEPVADPDGEDKLRGTDLQKFWPDDDPTTETNPRVWDTDSDGLKDGDEDKNVNGRFDSQETDPLNPDTDGDGLLDGKEIFAGTNSLDLDSDEDGLADGIEDVNQNGKVDPGETSPKLLDSDGDGLGDGLELGLTSGVEDPDGSGHLLGTDLTVFVGDKDPITTTDPLIWDADSDGLGDGEEDSNHNGRRDSGETDPLDPDTDNDGLQDGDETIFGSNPLDPASVAGISILLREEFTETSLDQWTIVDEGTIEAPSNWLVFETALLQSGNIYGGSDHTGAEDLNKPGTYIWRGSKGWQDYKILFKVRSDDDDGLGVMFRYLDSNNYYRFSMNREQGFARLSRFKDGEPTLLAKSSFRYEVGRWYLALIYVVGSRIQLFLDGSRLFDVKDDKLLNGAFAFYSWRNAGSWFKDVLIRGTDVTVDVQAHIDDFSYTSDDRGRILKWQIVAEDSYYSVKLERKEKAGHFQEMFFHRYNTQNSSSGESTVFVDRQPWLAVAYRLTLRDFQGNLLDTRLLDLESEPIKDFTLSAAYPNPFRDTAHFILRAPWPFMVRFRVYNILGQLVRSKTLEQLNAGWHQLTWDGKDDRNQQLPSGIYLLQIDVFKTRKTEQKSRTFRQKVFRVR